MKMMKNAAVVPAFVAACGFAYLNYPDPVEAKGVVRHDVFESKIAGTVNGDAFSADGKVVINAASGDFSLEVIFSNIPRGFHPLASSALSWLSISCSSCTPTPPPKPTPRPTPKPKALNICQISEGNFGALVEITILNGPKVIGELTQNIEIRRVRDGFFRAESRVDGWYSGPTNLVFSPGYRMVLRQLDRGKIEGVYSQEIFTADDRIITSSVRRSYNYRGNRFLPIPEIAILDAKEINQDGLFLTETGTARIVPADEVDFIEADESESPD